MRWRSAHIVVLVALTLVLLGTAPWLVRSTHGSDGYQVRRTGQAVRPPAGSTVYATVEAGPVGRAMPDDFLGFSFEYPAVQAYAGDNPAAPNPVFVQLLRNLTPAPGQSLVLRIGGNSTDSTWWPARRIRRPHGASYALTPDWLAGTRALAGAVGAQLILGVNLAAGKPAVAAAEARALVHGIGRKYISALEIGNEPDVYSVFAWYAGKRGVVFARGADYGLNAYIRQIARWSAALPKLPLAGPATAELSWMSGLAAVLRAAPRLRVVTVHRYALQGCATNPSSPAYPSAANLLSDRSTAGLAAAVAPYVAAAHAQGLQFRVDELNSAALAGCLGRSGVSDTFASALWALDTLFDMAAVGVDGVNIHSLPRAAYAPFTFTGAAGSSDAFVRPDYYGMLMFTRAFPPGAQLLPVAASAGPVKVWATRSPDGRTRVVLINQDSRGHRVELQVPGGGAASLQWLLAPSLASRSGVTLGGQTFGSQTATGRLSGRSIIEALNPAAGSYSVDLPPASAVLLTL